QAKALSSRTARSTFIDPREYRPDIRPATVMLLERALRAEPQERYRTYRELQDDLALLAR
ncbi:MAG: hypothetical protein D6744_03860, partial [Planctomycetota bacterium]